MVLDVIKEEILIAYRAAFQRVVPQIRIRDQPRTNPQRQRLLIIMLERLETVDFS